MGNDWMGREKLTQSFELIPRSDPIKVTRGSHSLSLLSPAAVPCLPNISMSSRSPRRYVRPYVWMLRQQQVVGINATKGSGNSLFVSCLSDRSCSSLRPVSRPLLKVTLRELTWIGLEISFVHNWIDEKEEKRKREEEGSMNGSLLLSSMDSLCRFSGGTSAHYDFTISFPATNNDWLTFHSK